MERFWAFLVSLGIYSGPGVKDGTWEGILDAEKITIEVSGSIWTLKSSNPAFESTEYNIHQCKVAYLPSRTGKINIDEHHGRITGAYRVLCERPLGLFYYADERLLMITGSDQPFVDFNWTGLTSSRKD